MKMRRRTFVLLPVAVAAVCTSNGASAAPPPSGIPCSARDSAVIANSGPLFSDAKSLVDSYQSSLGPYGGTNVGSDGDVGATTTIVQNGGVVHGTETQNSAAQLSVVPVPAGATNLPLGAPVPGSLNINDAAGSVTLAPGTYVAGNVNVSFPGSINVSPPGRVLVWVTGSLNLGGNENANGIPDNLEFLVTSSTAVNVNSPGKLFGFVYAPASIVNLDSSVFGGVVGSAVSLNSGSAVHFDQNSTCDQATGIATGNEFACALTERGGVKCWGINSSGALGDGIPNVTEPFSTVPAQVANLTSDATAVTAGNTVSACVLTTGGGVSCWGDIERIFTNPPVDATVPVPVTGFPSPATSVSEDEDVACSVTVGGGVSCWGGSCSYMFGNGGPSTCVFMETLTPVSVSGLTAADVSVGNASICAVTTRGGVVCWGDNTDGELGNGTSGMGTLTASSVPVPVTGLTSGVTAVSVGELFACALTAGGGVVCWGDNEFGQLGNGTMTASDIPVPVTGLASGVTALSAGFWSVCALTAGGGVVCWGLNGSGELGNGTTTTSSVPVPVTGLTSGVIAVSVGSPDPVCAVTTAGGVLCWGDDSGGELGNGTRTTTPSLVPVPVVGFP